MIYGSVCSGIEAATVAWHPLGWRPAFFAEIAAFPSAVLKHHYPDVPNVGDFTRMIHAAAPVPSIDVLVGGTPCQSFSVAGLRRGLADARGGLTLEFVRLAAALRPRWIVWENVPGVLSQDGGRAFGAFLGALGELGYGWAYRVLDAQYFGVAQRRRRVFVVGCAGGDFARAAAVLLEPGGVRRDPPTRREAGQRAAPTLAARTRGGGGLGTDFDFDGGLIRHDGGVGGVAHIVAPPLTASNDPSRSPQSSEVTAQVEAVLRAQYPEITSPICMAHGQGGAEIRVDGGARTLTCNHEAPIAAYARGGLNGQDAYTGRILPVVQCATGDRTRALTTRSAAEEDGTGRGTLIVPTRTMAVRRLTPVECERLQGFPDEYTAIPYRGKPAADGPRYRALGNSMAVPVMHWIGERIAKVEAV